MATLLIYEPDYNLIKLAPANISLPLPLMENVSNDDDRNNKTKKSSKKTGNKKKEEKRCIFGRAESSQSDTEERIQIIVKAQGKDIISRTHFSIIYNNDSKAYEVEDLGSTNGIYVNDIRVSTHNLQHNDILQIGGFNKNGINVGDPLPDECKVNCVKYKFIHDNDINIDNDNDNDNNIKKKIVGKSKNLKSPDRNDEPNLMNNNNKKKSKVSDSVNENERENDDISANIKAIKKVDNKINGNGNGNGKHINDNKNKNEQRELDILRSELYLKNQQDTISRELKQEKRKLEIEVNELKRKLVKYEKSKVEGTVNKIEIVSSVECPICGDIILNAAVLKCSHGFCMSCIESYWRKDETNKVARLKRKVTTKKGISTCPVCNDNTAPESDKSNVATNDKQISYEYLYHRSVHLDSICALLYEDRDALKERERRCKDILTGYGVDLDKCLIQKSGNDDEFESKEIKDIGDSNTHPLCSLCGSHHDAFDPCALDDVTEDDDDDDDEEDDDDMAL